jgi:hypothetical protein
MVHTVETSPFELDFVALLDGHPTPWVSRGHRNEDISSEVQQVDP